MLVSVPTDRVQGISIGQLRLSQLDELFRVGMQFQFGSNDLFHRTRIPEFHSLVNRCISVKICANSSPRLEAGGLLGAEIEIVMVRYIKWKRFVSIQFCFLLDTSLPAARSPLLLLYGTSFPLC